ncbi:unnamed protein product, partial [Staurois parvus]
MPLISSPDDQCPAVPCTSAQQCHPSVPISATHQCRPAVPTSRVASQCCQCRQSAVPISVAHQCCLSVPIIDAYQYSNISASSSMSTSA